MPRFGGDFLKVNVMNKCTSFWGHKWGKWSVCLGGPIRQDDGKFYRQKLQERVCLRCGFVDAEWINMFQLVEDEEPQPENSEEQS